MSSPATLRRPRATVIPLVLVDGGPHRGWCVLVATIGYVALYGTPTLQAGVAAGLVWVLLFGGVRAAAVASTAAGSDPDRLFRDTLIPRFAWKAAFVAVALYCLWKGFVLLKP